MLFVTVAVTIRKRRTGRAGGSPSFIAEIPFGSGNTEFQVAVPHEYASL
jgi:hypothetical protein